MWGVENLLNADVIRAAASSTLGILSLMCLILGIVALAFFRDAPVRARVLVFAMLLLGVAGFGYAILNQRSTNAIPEASHEFVSGRWQVEQKVAGIEGGSFVDYSEDGSFSGRQEAFIGGQGRREQVSGSWYFTKLTKDQFRLKLIFDNGSKWQGTFRILDPDRIHNMDENYDAMRVQR